MNLRQLMLRSAITLSVASRGNPVVAILTAGLSFLAFNTLEAEIETLLFGQRFLHLLGLAFLAAFIIYICEVIRCCAAYNEYNQQRGKQTP